MRFRPLLLAPAAFTLAAFGCQGAADRGADGGTATITTDAVSVSAPAAVAPPPAPPPVAREESHSLGFGGATLGRSEVSRPVAAEQMASKRAADATVANVRPTAQLPFGGGAGRVDPDMVIRSGQASVQVDSLDLAVAHVRQLAQRVGGSIANSSLQSGRDQVRAATLEIRVPAPRFDELVAGLAPFGKVETVNVTAEDVGEEFVDLTARVTNARRLEQRLIELLATRTGKLSDVLTVERELARVREEIERYEGRLRYLQARSAVSTLAVTVHEPFPILAGAPSSNPIARAFIQAWRNFVGLLAVLIASLGVLLPLAGIALLGWLGWTRVRRQARPAAGTVVGG
jgi:hypothetical protein